MTSGASEKAPPLLVHSVALLGHLAVVSVARKVAPAMTRTAVYGIKTVV